VPDINIPIYTVEEGSLSLPISLNYHASGLKVAEMASWVGAGWSLNAGGIITRTVQGIPDENFPHGYYNEGNLIPNKDTQNFQWQQFLIACSQGLKDSEPDIFSFNVGGFSGKFYIDHKDAKSLGKPKYQFLPQMDLKLDFNPDFTSFTIITPDGNRYTFGQIIVNGVTINARENSKDFTNNGFTFCTSWYLLTVESADLSHIINLTYEKEDYNYINPAGCNKIIASTGCENFPVSMANGYGEYCTGPNLDSYHYYTTTKVEGQRLSNISSNTCSLIFKSPPLIKREDIGSTNDSKYLESISITSGTLQTICKKFDFAYTYFQDPAKPNDAFGKKLKLNSIQEKSCDGISIVNNPHVFIYNGDFLPYRLLKATDHWGYYNGANQNETLRISVPPTTIQVNGGLVTNDFTYGSANKESNEIEMKKGVLTEIRYPTGGKTVFITEANVAYTNALLTTYNKLSLQGCINTPANCCGVKTNQSGNIAFTAEELLNNATKFKIQIWPIKTNNAGQTVPCANVTDANVSVQSFRSSDNLAMGTPLSFNILSTLTTDSIKGNLLTLGQFQAGVNYYFKITVRDAYATLTINSTPVIYDNKIIGGLRIKEIRTSETLIQTANDIIKTYEYLKPNSILSSGSLYNKPTYGIRIFKKFIVQYSIPPTPGDPGGMGLIGFYVDRSLFQEQTIVPLSNFDGIHYRYEFVKEKNNGNGEKLFKFKVINQYPIPDFPETPVILNVTNGKLETEQTFNSANIKVAERNEFGTDANIISSSKEIHKVMSIPPNCIQFFGERPLNFQSGFVTYSPYQISSSRYNLLGVTETIDGITTTTAHTYDPYHRYLSPTATSFTNSDGKVQRTEMKYAFDLPTSAIRTELIARNIIGTPLETLQKVDGTTVGGSKTEYRLFDVSGLITLFILRVCLDRFNSTDMTLLGMPQVH
jgi:hypothetical protein